jgi:hypothetical protein
MIRLTQTFGAHAGRVREFDQDVVRCGRLPTNDFPFDPHADLDASGNHAELRREAGKWVLVDAGSRNGTLVNGRPVQRQVIEGGEEIEFGTGGPRVRVEIVGAASAIPPSRVPQSTAPATPLEAPPSAPAMPAPSVGAGVPTPVWTGTPSPAPRGGELRSPLPSVGSSSDPKRYGQQTLDAAVDAAEARGRASASSAPMVQIDRAELTRLEEQNKQNRTLAYGLAAIVVLLLGAVCLLGAAVTWLAFGR